MDDDSDRFDSLLTGGYLSGEDYDAIGARVLDQVAPAPRRTLGGRWVTGAGLSLSAAAALVFVLSRPGGFTTKGDSVAEHAEVDVTCSDPVDTRCRPGDTLHFVVRTPSVRYLSAHAQRIGTPAQSRIWYFPSPDGQFLQVGGGALTREVASEGIRIGPEHTPGRYRIEVWLSARPITREALTRAGREAFAHSVHEIEIAP